jgi:hypothetical protein
MPGHFLIYFCVQDCDWTAATVVRLGGRVKVPPFDIPYGRIAVLSDNQGAAFAVLSEPNAPPGPAWAPAVREEAPVREEPVREELPAREEPVREEPPARDEPVQEEPPGLAEQEEPAAQEENEERDKTRDGGDADERDDAGDIPRTQ